MLIHKYNITYCFPWGSVEQEKVLVSHEEWRRFSDAEKRLNLAKKTEDRSADDEYIVRNFKRTYGDQIFTDRSPIHDAIETGNLKTPYTECRVVFKKTILHKID